MGSSIAFFWERRPDLSLILMALVLVGLGMVMVYSSSAVLAQATFESEGFFLRRQGIRVAFGVGSMVLAAMIPYRSWARVARPLLGLGVLLLVVVLLQRVAGVSDVRGAYRWLRVGGVAFQPSEMVKFIVVLYLADSLARRGDRIRDFGRGFLPYLIILSVISGLIVAQPDLGTALAVGIIAGLMLFVARARIVHLLATGLVAAVATVVLILATPYRMNRLEAFLHTADRSDGVSYQITQSMIGIGSGGLTGVGLGQGRQKLFFLPEPHTDFIFAVVGEELGFVGALGLLVLFLLFVWRGLRVALAAPDRHGFFLAFGIVAAVAVYAGLNIGVATGLLPTTGLPLPFVSYGGTSLATNLAATGILANVARGDQGWV